MLPACRTAGEAFAVPTFDLVRSDVEGFMEELWEFQAAFHDCFTRSEPRAHFFDYMVGQLSPLERKFIEPMALQGEGGTIRGLQQFISDVRWDEEQMQWNYHQLVADAMGEPDGVLMFDETGGLDHGVGHPSCLVILTLVVGFSGCTGIAQTEQSALSGGAIGAVGGAWLGAMAGNAGMGVAIGGEGGLTGGYLYGKHKEAEQKASQSGYQQRREPRGPAIGRADCWAVTEPGAVGQRLLHQHDVEVTLPYRLTMLRNAKDDDWVPTVMESKMARFPTRAVGRVSLDKCRERMEEEKVDRSTLVILAIEAFEMLRVNNQW